MQDQKLKKNLVDVKDAFDVHVRLEAFLDPVGVRGQLLDELTFLFVASDNHI